MQMAMAGGRATGRVVRCTAGVVVIGLLTAAADVRAVDLELGRYLATECMTCHGTASATSTIPNIFGLGEGHFVEVIRAYRVKALPNPIMQSIAGRLNDEDIAALAAYFETAKK